MMLRFANRKALNGALIALAAALLVNLGFYSGLFEALVLKAFDMRAKYNSSPSSPDVAIILVDEASLREMNPIGAGGRGRGRSTRTWWIFWR